MNIVTEIVMKIKNVLNIFMNEINKIIQLLIKYLIINLHNCFSKSEIKTSINKSKNIHVIFIVL